LKDVSPLLRECFERCAPHIYNLDEMRSLVESVAEKHCAFPETVAYLQERMQEAETTLRTDIRILLNELKHANSIRKTKA
jgi:hypothetical protein